MPANGAPDAACTGQPRSALRAGAPPGAPGSDPEGVAEHVADGVEEKKVADGVAEGVAVKVGDADETEGEEGDMDTLVGDIVAERVPVGVAVRDNVGVEDAVKVCVCPYARSAQVNKTRSVARII